MPVLNESNVTHLLRRAEFVARPERVATLLGAGSFENAVDDVLATGDPGTVSFQASADWQRGQELVHYWIDRMAFDSPRPIQERMALFWHGHFVSSLDKVGSAELMREQIDLYRRDGLGNVRHLAVTMATQVAMLRYLDNNDNRRTSPNQNFGRELMELFLLGVGNYTEADVEACTAAWTGHTDNWETDAYVWRGGDPNSGSNWRERSSNWHDYSPKQLLGRTINTDNSHAAGPGHGAETITTMLGNGTVPVGPNAGRPTRDVSAEFLTRKLWTFFAGTSIPDHVLADLRNVLVGNDFAVRPWLRALLLREELYTIEVQQGLLRSPVEYMVAMLVATGLRSKAATPTWLMEGMGQELLYPPNVSGWRHNGYYVSASAFNDRISAARQVQWRVLDRYWGSSGDDTIHLPGGNVTAGQIDAADDPSERRAIVDQLAAGMRLTLSDTTRQALHAYADTTPRWAVVYAVGMLLMSPEMHVS